MHCVMAHVISDVTMSKTNNFSGLSYTTSQCTQELVVGVDVMYWYKASRLSKDLCLVNSNNLSPQSIVILQKLSAMQSVN